MSLPADIKRDERLTHENVNDLIAMESIFGGQIQPVVADRMLKLLDEDRTEGHDHPPGYVALMEAARTSLIAERKKQ